LKEKLIDSVKIHLRSDVPLGAFLSAGLDSSAIVALMCKLTDQPIQTFSAGFENPHFDEISGQKILSDFPDFRLKNERLICKTADAALIQKTIWHREDPSSMTTTVPRMMLSELAYSRNIKVALLGEGSDEIFGGYNWFRTERLARILKHLPFGIPERVSQIPLLKKKRSIFSKLLGSPPEMNFKRYSYMIHQTAFNENVFSEGLRQKIKIEPDELDSRLPAEFHTWHPFHQLQYFELTVRLPDLIIRNVDSSSMANSVEARVPFLDHELVEFCSEIPISLKMRGFREKHILRQAMVNILPPEIVSRKKNPLLAPTQQWLQNLPDFARELLSKNKIVEKGYFNPAAVAALQENIRQKSGVYREPLMEVLQVQIWDDLFRSSDSPQF
jgi:asparagine synthase (glutamine-hydrolysing)